MTDLAGFLLKRIEETERAARSNLQLRAGLDVEIRSRGSHNHDEYRIGSVNAWRRLTPEVHAQIYETLPPDQAVIADCSVKRNIVEYCSRRVQDYRADALAPVLHLLAALYADHPDFDQAWRVDG